MALKYEQGRLVRCWREETERGPQGSAQAIPSGRGRSPAGTSVSHGHSRERARGPCRLPSWGRSSIPGANQPRVAVLICVNWDGMRCTRIRNHPGHSGAQSVCVVSGWHPGHCSSRTFPSLWKVLLHRLSSTALPSRISGRRLHPGPTHEPPPSPTPTPGTASGIAPVSTKGLLSFPLPPAPCSRSSSWQQPCSPVPAKNNRGEKLEGDVGLC